jgi:hypothetical protein
MWPAAALRLADVAGPADSARLHALVAGAQGRVSIAWGDPVSHILAKLNLRNRAEAAAYAVGVLGAVGDPASRRP